MNENKNTTLWLPEGSIRAILSFMVLIFTFICVLYKVNEGIALFGGLSGMAMQNYFNKKDVGKKE